MATSGSVIGLSYHRPNSTLEGLRASRRQRDTERLAWWLYSDFVVDGTLNPLFATEISFGCLNRNVTKQQLDLLQFASGGLAKPCTGSPKIVRS